MKRKSLKSVRCPIARTLDLVGEWWTLLILRDAFAGMKRFTEFQQSLGLAKNVLSARLKKLVEADILQTLPAENGSAYQEYQLTDKGRSLFTVMVAIRQWGELHLCKTEELDVVLVDRQQQLPVRALQLRSAKGRVLQVEDLALVAKRH